MQYFGNFETLLHSRFPELDLVVHNLGWSADELTLRPRSGRLQGPRPHARRTRSPTSSSPPSASTSRSAARRGSTSSRRTSTKFIKESTTTKYNGKSPPSSSCSRRSPRKTSTTRTSPTARRTTRTSSSTPTRWPRPRRSTGVVFVDLFTPIAAALRGRSRGAEPLTINGIHLNEEGDATVGRDPRRGPLRPPAGATIKADLAKLKAEVNEKNLQFWYDYRAINGCYIYGGRKAPFGIVNFPAEFAKLRKMIAEPRAAHLGRRPGRRPSPTRSTTATPASSSASRPTSRSRSTLTTPEEAIKTFKLPEGYEINLFASEVEFPDLKKPVQMTFDAKGRLWVTTMPSYPMYLPGQPGERQDPDLRGHQRRRQGRQADRLRRRSTSPPASSSATAASTSPSSRT